MKHIKIGLTILSIVSLNGFALARAVPGTVDGDECPWTIVVECNGDVSIIDDGCYGTVNLWYDSNPDLLGYETHVVFSPCGYCNCD